MNGVFNDLTGERFGRLLVLNRVENDGSSDKHARWKCLCDCGKTKVIRSNALLRGATVSCGCYHSDRVVDTHTKHGLHTSRIYNIYRGMTQRCNNPNAPRFDRYGGRGIKVCDEWKSSFETFYKWAMDNGYSDDLTIDRIDNDKDYTPENCRWADKDTQNNNKSTSHYLTAFGETLTIAQWAKKTGINKNTIFFRITKFGYTPEEAVTYKPKEGRYRCKNTF